MRDEERLAGVVATLLLGLHAHAISLLRSGDNVAAPALPASARQGAVKATLDLLRAPPSSPTGYARDGLLFQLISWVAAQQVHAASGALVRAPHVRPSDKGLDGLILQPPSQHEGRWHAVICEDKATDSPRNLLTSKVWPEFRKFETGERDGEVTADAVALLAANRHSQEQIVRITDDLWQGPHYYRAAVTTDGRDSAQLDHSVMFKGYDDTVDGPFERRCAESFPLAEPIRDWMERFSGLVAGAINAAARSLPAAPADGHQNSISGPTLTGSQNV